MDAASFHQNPSWNWPDDLSQHAGHAGEQPPRSTDTGENSAPRPQRHYPPRTCRICLETVYPSTKPASEHLPSYLQPPPRVVYESADPELGRLLRPCKCKGTSRYVHEGCLRKWRHADPNYGKRNYWQCPTCGFRYRLERVTYAHWISSKAAQIVLTFGILLLTVFLLGFIADPIINLYVDPIDTILGADFYEPDVMIDVPLDDSENKTWTEHFLKGLASLGILSFIKAIVAMSPWNFFNIRGSGLVGGRRTGRSRVASISWMVVLLGVMSFLWTVYKGVRHWARRTLESASDRVMDVPLPDDDEEEEQTTATSEADKKNQ
ncbi:hypothetical protein VTN31DRAFT_7093 [Thermomyces dupontii]|uniref:uncharacterized protein n=1 Tax=Talaromyces thermophilus TaxID=28565 RepID=UPI003743DADE